jgi:hypothetical protein
VIGDGFGRRRCRLLEEGGSPDMRARDVSQREGKGITRHELVRKKKRRLDDFGNVTRSLETILRDWRSNEFDESNSMAAVRARARGGSAHKSHSGFERTRWPRSVTGLWPARPKAGRGTGRARCPRRGRPSGQPRGGRERNGRQLGRWAESQE